MTDDLYMDVFWFLNGRKASAALVSAYPAATRAPKGAYRCMVVAGYLARLPSDNHLHRVADVARREG